MYKKIFKIDKMAFEPILKDFDRKYLFHELIREKVCNVFFKSHTSEPNISEKVWYKKPRFTKKIEVEEHEMYTNK